MKVEGADFVLLVCDIVRTQLLLSIFLGHFILLHFMQNATFKLFKEARHIIQALKINIY